MTITKNSVVRFHYSLKNNAGEEIESSFKQEPTTYLHGYNNIIPGLQNCLEGKSSGEKFTTIVTPEQGYGARREDSSQRIPTKHLIGAKKWRPGMLATVQTEHGPKQVTVVKTGKFMVEVDNNHPLAGLILHFDIEIVEVREASSEEISHGHVHGVGGHQH